jgi:hypothetical protein
MTMNLGPTWLRVKVESAEFMNFTKAPGEEHTGHNAIEAQRFYNSSPGHGQH